MIESCGSLPNPRRGERGAGRLKFIITLAVVAIIAYMGFQYVPVAFHAYTLKRSMDDVVEKAAVSNVPTDSKGQWAADQIRASANDYGVPPNAKYTPAFQNGRVSVTVQFTRPVNLLPGITYQYAFDYTAQSSSSFSP